MTTTAFLVTCPHCKKEFSGAPLGGDPRHRGFKCPHCRLFVPYDRAAEAGPLEERPRPL